jgi:hypothetical protein
MPNIHTYIHTYIHPYIHTYIHTSLSRHGRKLFLRKSVSANDYVTRYSCIAKLLFFFFFLSFVALLQNVVSQNVSPARRLSSDGSCNAFFTSIMSSLQFVLGPCHTRPKIDWKNYISMYALYYNYWSIWVYWRMYLFGNINLLYGLDSLKTS